ncbi:hypothetical protein CSB20_07730 [bacterium DOLZORAL124_64_63]|nr:MAG: hypothetical protein CSB20_07730 [bacterium DOLZORAL124_64_63]
MHGGRQLSDGHFLEPAALIQIDAVLLQPLQGGVQILGCQPGSELQLDDIQTHQQVVQLADIPMAGIHGLVQDHDAAGGDFHGQGRARFDGPQQRGAGRLHPGLVLMMVGRVVGPHRQKIIHGLQKKSPVSQQGLPLQIQNIFLPGRQL